MLRVLCPLFCVWVRSGPKGALREGAVTEGD